MDLPNLTQIYKNPKKISMCNKIVFLIVMKKICLFIFTLDRKKYLKLLNNNIIIKISHPDL